MMDDLILRTLQGRTTPEEQRRLRAWMARDPSNERRFRELRRLWTLVGAAAPEPGEETVPDVDALIERAEGLDEEPERQPAAPAPAGVGAEDAGRPGWVRWGRRTAAAALAAGLVAVGFGIGGLGDEGQGPTLLSESEIVTGAGEMTTLTLGDGSSIRVGPESRIRLWEDDGRRMASLEGRAFFGIQADSARPFTVKTGQGEAQVLGTRFEVRTEEEEFRVLVVDGSVAVSAGGTDLELSEGEMSRSVRGSRPSTERVDDVYAHLDWIGNAIVFQATPLERALREIERRYGVVVSLENPGLRNLTVTATFTGRPVDQVIVVLCEIVNTTCEIEGDRVRIGAVDDRATHSADAP